LIKTAPKVPPNTIIAEGPSTNQASPPPDSMAMMTRPNPPIIPIIVAKSTKSPMKGSSDRDFVPLFIG